MAKDPGAILTDAQIELIQRLCSTSALSDSDIARRFDLPVKVVTMLRRTRYWDRTAGKHDVGLGPKKTVAEIAKIAGLSHDGVHKRLARGLTGRELIAPRGTMQRTKRLEKIPRKRILTPRVVNPYKNILGENDDLS